jgi:hypothetical protein
MPKLEALSKTHSALIAKTRSELAMNFEIPARDTIQMACAEMRISEKQWRKLCDYCDSIEAMTGTRHCPIHGAKP